MRMPSPSATPTPMRIHWSVGSHSSSEPHGRMASDVGDASLVPRVGRERATDVLDAVGEAADLAVVSVAAVVTLAGHVEPLSGEHSKRNSEMLSSAVGQVHSGGVVERRDRGFAGGPPV